MTAPEELPARSRGVIALIEESCTSCMLCARECPSWCIHIDSHAESTPPARPSGREQTRHVLDRFAIDYSVCMYCSICVEVCPFDALHWAPAHDYPAEQIADLTHERDELREWMWGVPVPDVLDEGAVPAKEQTAARTALDRAAGRPARW